MIRAVVASTLGAGAVTLLPVAAGTAVVNGGSDTATASSHALERPVLGAVITQGFGCTAYQAEPVDRACPGGHRHSGIDLAAPMGTPVRSVSDGVAHVLASTNGYGLHVILDDGQGLSTLYAHLSAVTVANDAGVSAGDVIGAVGSSGNSSGPHLHFEVRRDGLPEDPLLDVSLP
ncbi:MAG: M23 family metallopeptidase [Chloroflexi bacterium]|nr:MAG: M23 family metallopeptidase [Chloroflexota bacterium]